MRNYAKSRKLYQTVNYWSSSAHIVHQGRITNEAVQITCNVKRYILFAQLACILFMGEYRRL